MINQQLDLDELAPACVTKSAKRYIGEAVACYKSGAYRSTIIVAWIALVSDVLHKLSDLKLTGDKNATQHLTDFEKRQKDPRGFVGLELDILQAALTFEFINTVEHKELLRVYEDRNKCAHVSVTDPDDVYEPTAELARNHMRSAVHHLLRHEAVQGKAALEQIMKTVQSLYFPTDDEKAYTVLSGSLLRRPKTSLVRNFIICLFKEFLSITDLGAQQRYAAAMNAVRKLHASVWSETCTEKLMHVVATTPDALLSNAIILLTLVDDVHQYFTAATKIKIGNLVEGSSSDQLVPMLWFALHVPDFAQNATSRLDRTNSDELAQLIAFDANAVFVDHALQLYQSSGSWNTANSRGTQLILPLLSTFDATQLERLIRIAGANGEVRDSHTYSDIKRKVIAMGVVTAERIEELEAVRTA